MRAPYCNKAIPVRAMRRVFGRMNAFTPDAEIEGEVRRRCAEHPGWNARLTAQAVRYALYLMTQYRSEYYDVMGGR